VGRYRLSFEDGRAPDYGDHKITKLLRLAVESAYMPA